MKTHLLFVLILVLAMPASFDAGLKFVQDALPVQMVVFERVNEAEQLLVRAGALKILNNLQA